MIGTTITKRRWAAIAWVSGKMAGWEYDLVNGWFSANVFEMVCCVVMKRLCALQGCI